MTVLLSQWVMVQGGLLLTSGIHYSTSVYYYYLITRHGCILVPAVFKWLN